MLLVAVAVIGGLAPIIAGRLNPAPLQNAQTSPQQATVTLPKSDVPLKVEGGPVQTTTAPVGANEDLGPTVHMIMLLSQASKELAAHDNDGAIRDATQARAMLAAASGVQTVSTRLIQAQMELLLQRATTAKGDLTAAQEHAAAVRVACNDVKSDAKARPAERKAADDLIAVSASVK